MMKQTFRTPRRGRPIVRWLATALLLAQAPTAAAVTITADIVPPTPAAPLVGNTVTLELSIAGLGVLDAPSVTAFDIDLAFDDSVVGFGSVVFPALAGLETCTPGTFTETCDAFSSFAVSPDSVNLAVAAFISPTTVNATQASAGTLAVLEFTVLSLGTIDFAFADVDLAGTVVGDTVGALGVTTVGASLATAPVPEPGSATLLLVGLTGVALRRNRRPR